MGSNPTISVFWKTLVNAEKSFIYKGFRHVWPGFFAGIFWRKTGIFKVRCNTNATRKSHAFERFKVFIDFFGLPDIFQINDIAVYGLHNIVRRPASAL